MVGFLQKYTKILNTKFSLKVTLSNNRITETH